MSADTSIPLSAATRVCAVYGHPVRHSASPAMQNAGIAALQLDWRYLAFDVLPAELAVAIRGAAAMRFIGLNLTVPHKLLALDMMDALDESARAWGAVNTVRFEIDAGDGCWRPLGQVDPAATGVVRAHGFNTDADAILEAIRTDLQIVLGPESRVLLLGAGGAGRVAALRLAAHGVGRLHLVNRTPSKAAALRQEILDRFPACSVETGYPRDPVDLILNATSLGLTPDDPLPIDLDAFSLGSASHVFDMIYRPAETPLLQLARQAGCSVANGLGMLLHQGARSLEIWSGRTAPQDCMRAALHCNVYG